jgi:hypothetical protein
LEIREEIVACKKINERKTPCERLAVQIVLNHIGNGNACANSLRRNAPARGPNALDRARGAEVILHPKKR